MSFKCWDMFTQKKKKMLGYDLHIEDQNYKFFVNSKLQFIVSDEIGLFIYEDYNISTKMIYLGHGGEDFQLLCLKCVRYIKLDYYENNYSINNF